MAWGVSGWCPKISKNIFLTFLGLGTNVVKLAVWTLNFCSSWTPYRRHFMFKESSSEMNLLSASEGRQSAEVDDSPLLSWASKVTRADPSDWSWPKVEDLGGHPYSSHKWQNFLSGEGHLGQVKSKRMTLVGGNIYPNPLSTMPLPGLLGRPNRLTCLAGGQSW